MRERVTEPLRSNHGDFITTAGVVASVDVADVVARSAVELVPAVAVLGLEAVVPALAVQHVAVGREGVRVDEVAVAPAYYVVGHPVAAPLVEGIAVVGAVTGVPGALLVDRKRH